MSNYLNSSYTSLNNLVFINGDSGNIDTLSCKTLIIGGTDYTSYNNNLENQITNLQTTDTSLQNQITNLQTTDTSLQNQINNIISSSANDLKTIMIGTTTTLDPGDNATVVNVGTSQNMILDFGIPRGYRGYSGSDGSKGDKGDTGEKGDKGDRGSDGSSVGIETVIGIIEGIFTQLEIAGLQAQITALAGQITLIIIRLEALEAKTVFQSILGNNTRFTSNLGINNGVSV